MSTVTTAIKMNKFTVTRSLTMYLLVTRWCKAFVTPSGHEAEKKRKKSERERRKDIKHVKDMRIQEDTV